MMTERTFSKKMKGDLEELMVRIRSRTWFLMEKTPSEERFPPEPFTFEMSQLIIFFQDSPDFAMLVALSILFGLAGGYYLATRPPLIDGEPPPYPETI